jgi:hypothetical protein
MIVIAKTNSDFLIQATESEIKEIVNAVTGQKPYKVEIGQKLPAIDYASTITKLKSLKDDYCFTSLLDRANDLMKTVESIEAAVNSASKIED